MKIKDDKVQDAQDYLREIAEPGSYLEEIADLLEQLYFEANKSAKKKIEPVTARQLQQKKAAQTMSEKSNSWAAGGYKRI